MLRVTVDKFTSAFRYAGQPCFEEYGRNVLEDFAMNAPACDRRFCIEHRQQHVAPQIFLRKEELGARGLGLRRWLRARRIGCAIACSVTACPYC